MESSRQPYPLLCHCLWVGSVCTQRQGEGACTAELASPGLAGQPLCRLRAADDLQAQAGKPLRTRTCSPFPATTQVLGVRLHGAVRQWQHRQRHAHAQPSQSGAAGELQGHGLPAASPGHWALARHCSMFLGPSGTLLQLLARLPAEQPGKESPSLTPSEAPAPPTWALLC